MSRESTTTSLVDRIQETGAALRAALMPLVTELAGSPPRPGQLVARLGLDKSLSSRLARALRCDSDLELVHQIPSPTGLRILLSALESAPVPAPARAEAERAVDRFQRLLDTTPAGQAAIDAQISERSVEVREKREHVAKQAAYKAMSFLLGYYCETLTTTLVIAPGRTAQTVDAFEIHQRYGMRRLRPNTPLALMSVLTPPDDEPRDGSTWIETLDGATGLADATQFLLPEFSTDPLPELEVLVEPDLTTFVLSEDDPALDDSVSITSGFHIRNAWERFRTAEVDHAVRGYILHMPCKRLVRDLFIVEGIYEGAIPEITFQLSNPAGRPGARPEGLRGRISTLDLSAPIEQLRPTARGVAVRGVPEYGDVVSSVLSRLDLDLARLRGYRCEMAYPVPLIEMVWWLPLPANPGGTADGVQAPSDPDR